MLPPCLDASGGMILRAMGFGWGKQARVCFPLPLGKALRQLADGTANVGSFMRANMSDRRDSGPSLQVRQV